MESSENEESIHQHCWNSR